LELRRFLGRDLAPLIVSEVQRATRFAVWPKLPSRLLLVLLLLLGAYGATINQPAQPAQSPAASAVDVTDSDLALYKAVAGRVAEGQGYYPAVVAEQRVRDYPLKPIVTVRLPTLATLIGTVGPDAASLLLHLLALAAAAALALRLKIIAASRLRWAVATSLGAAAIALLTVPALTFWHEAWAGLLITLSLACRTPKRWIASVALGLCAVTIRELALPYLFVMAAMAWRDGNRSEALAWTGSVILFGAALGGHAFALSQHVLASDAASPGWSSAGGWPFILQMMQRCTLFAFVPHPILALLLPLSLLGWTALRTPMFERGALILIGYIVAFMLIGRADNFYWAILLAPLLPIGLAFAPAALKDLFAASAPTQLKTAPSAA
jgi:hypothetical protein